MIPRIQNAVVVHGEIYLPSDDPLLLTQDMFEARLATGVILDVGWFPENDPNGEYVVTAFIDPDNMLSGPIVTSDPNEVQAIVLGLAEVFRQPESYLSSSDTTYPTYSKPQSHCYA